MAVVGRKIGNGPGVNRKALRHRHLSTELQDLANDTAITENAPGAKVNPQQIQADVEDQGPSYKKAKTVQNALTDVMDMVIFRTIFFELLVFFTFMILTLHFAY